VSHLPSGAKLREILPEDSESKTNGGGQECPPHINARGELHSPAQIEDIRAYVDRARKMFASALRSSSASNSSVTFIEISLPAVLDAPGAGRELITVPPILQSVVFVTRRQRHPVAVILDRVLTKHVLMKALIVLLLTAMATAALKADDRAKKVDQLFAMFDKPGSPGCSVGIIRDGDFIYKKSFGYASLELAVPLSSSSVFYMGSVSKQFTAASIVLAAEQGHLTLDDDVRKYLPELPDYGRRITLRQMLHQTSGFRDFLDLVFISGRNAADLASPTEILKLIARQKSLNNLPGDEWVYSNSNYFLLGEIVRRATGKSLAAFAAENIFRPLGMMHTLFYDDNTLVVSNRVAAYDPGPEGNFLVDWSTTYAIVGGGGLMSSVDDLLLWDRNFYNNRLGKGTLPSELQSHGSLNNGNQIDYALGLSLGDYRGLPIVEHSGELFGYHSSFLRFPQQKFSSIVLCNLSTAEPEALTRKIADLYLAADFEPTKSTLAADSGPPDPAAFAGTYLDPRSKTIYSFTADHGNLMGWGSVLQRIDAKRFYDLGSNIITFEKVNGTMHCSLVIPGEIYFSGDKLASVHLTEAELNKLAGRYRSDELDVTYTLSAENGKLAVRQGDKPAVIFEAVTSNEFYSSDFCTLVFEPDADRRTSGFNLFTQAARGIHFNRLN
jgi:CubicO group peptidase (beta-lactamase class C family)